MTDRNNSGHPGARQEPPETRERTTPHNRLEAALSARFGDLNEVSRAIGSLDEALAQRLADVAARSSRRTFRADPPPLALIELLAAVALSAPSKSDLQQRDIIVMDDTAQLSALKALLAEQAWIAGAPALVVFCANNRRQRMLHDMTGHAFANDHLDAFFNATVDAAVALQAFVMVAETAGLGCCPISAIRNKPREVSDILGLPDHVFAIAGLAVGWPASAGDISPRLPLAATLHRDRYNSANDRDHIAAYDTRRASQRPFRSQRHVGLFGELPQDRYVWSEDKARHYAVPERDDFGDFVRLIGYTLD